MKPLYAIEVVEIANQRRVPLSLRSAFFDAAAHLLPIGGMDEKYLAEILAERAVRIPATRPQDLLTIAAAFLRVEYVEKELVDFFRTPDMTVGEFMSRVDPSASREAAA